jgi:predicted phage-related endonuclease
MDARTVSNAKSEREGLAMGTPIQLSMPHTDQWHADRRTGWGASELAKLANKSIYGTAFESVQRKLGRLPDIEETLPMRRGTRVEPMIVEEACENLGRSALMYPCPLFRSETHSFLLATPDAMLDQDEGIECKKTNWRMASQLGDEGTGFENSGDHVVDWVCQAQGQMAVMGWSRVWVAVLVDLESPVRLYPVERNPTLIDMLTAIAAEMWQRVLNDDPPEPTWSHPSTLGLMKQIHGNVDDGKIITLSQEAIAAQARRAEIAAQVKALETEETELKARLLAELGDANAGDLGDGFVMRRKIIAKEPYMVTPKPYVDFRKMKLDSWMKG